jgi:hypothetical protein
MKSIFVQISAYEDYELPKTILSCINKSSKQYKIHFGINLVYNKYDIKIPDVKNLKIFKSKAPLNLGVGEGRFIANSFYDNQEYYLQIDSHTRFINNWDLEIVKTYNSYKSLGCNPILTAYPARYWYENNVEILDPNMDLTSIEFKTEDIDFFNKTKFYHQKAVPKNNSVLTKSISGGSVFSDGSISKIFPNKKMFNWGEEMLYAIRLFTHGYDLMIPEKQYLYHLYYDNNNPKYNFRSLSGIDFPEETNRILDESNKEIYRILSNNVVGDQELGTIKTLKDFEIYAGIRFLDGTRFDPCTN